MAQASDIVSHKKFGFDTVFDADGGVAFTPARARLSYSPAEVEEVRAAAYAEGERSTIALADADCARALEQIAQACRQAFGSLAQVAHSHRTGSAELALAAGRKIADAALARFPEAPVAAALAELAREVEAAPRLVVKVAPDLVERVQAALNDTANNVGYAGQIVANPDPALPAAAFTLDWGEGRAAFDPEAAAARIAAALDTALAAEGLHAEPLIADNPSTGSENDDG